MNDLERARAHLKQAEQGGDAGDATAEATIALAYANIALADRLGPIVDHLVKPLRMVVREPQEPDLHEGSAWREDRAAFERARDEARARERQARLAMVDAVVLEGGVVVHPGEPGTPGYDPKDDPAVWAPQEQVFDDPTPARGPGGIFGQMEERPNALEDQAEH